MKKKICESNHVYKKKKYINQSYAIIIIVYGKNVQVVWINSNQAYF